MLIFTIPAELSNCKDIYRREVKIFVTTLHGIAEGKGGGEYGGDFMLSLDQENETKIKNYSNVF
jgi:hypothetical protein